MEHAIFLLAGATSFISACLLVSRRNPIYSVIFMLPFFLGLAVIFVLLSAPFLAAMQVMVYGGAILVVFLFVIMLINLRPAELKSDFSTSAYLLPAALAGLLGALILGFVLTGIPSDSKLEKAFSRKVGANPEAVGAQKGEVQAASDAKKGEAKPAAGAVETAARQAEPAGKAPFGSVESLSLPLFRQFLVPFELLSLLIVVAILGVVVLAKRKL
jgi:NADH-quinone oxidoreductase subunit J